MFKKIAFFVFNIICFIVFSVVFASSTYASIQLHDYDGLIDTDTSYAYLDLYDVPENSTLLLFASYRSNFGDFINSVEKIDSNSAYFEYGCQGNNNEYYTETWHLSGEYVQAGDLGVEIYWDDQVQDIHLAVLVYTGVDPIDPVYACSYGGAWSQNPSLSVTSDDGHVIVGAVGTFTGDFNTLTPNSSDFIEEIWHTPNINNVVMNIASWHGASDSQVGWSMSRGGGWPWGAVAVSLAPSGASGDGPEFYISETNSSASSDFSSVYFSNIPIDSTVVFTGSYRNPGGGFLDSVEYYGMNTDYFSYGCLQSYNEYVTEIWYYAGTSEDSFYVDAYWSDSVEDIRIGAAVFTGVNTSDPVSDMYCDSDWSQYPSVYFPTSSSDLVFGAIGSFTGDFNTITANDALQTIWHVPYTGNVVTNAALWQGDPDLYVSWDMSRGGGWPWAMAAIALQGGSGGGGNNDPPPQDNTPPFIILDEPTDPVLSSSFFVSGIVMDSQSPIDRISYVIQEVGFGEPFPTNIFFGGNNSSEFFSFDVTDVPDGSWILKIYAYDTVGNGALAAQHEFVVGDAPVCELDNIPSPTSNQQPMHTGSCTDPLGISEIAFTYYEVLEGTVVPLTQVTELLYGSYGDTYIEFSFSPEIIIPDGSYIVQIIAENELGISSSEATAAVDFVVIEAVDDLPPTLIFNQILPNPTIDTQPFITGACRDVHQFETNSNIASIEYRLNSSNPGDWVNMPAHDGAYDSAIESFSVRLPELSVGEHTIEVRCSDAAGNSTDDNATSQTQTIEVVAPSGATADVISFTEDFSTQLRNSIFYTDAIWGNGLVRLKETIDYTVTDIDTDAFGARYGPIGATSGFDVVRGTDSLVWYVKQSQFVRYDMDTQQSTVFLGSTYGINNIYTMAQTKNGAGDELVMVGSGNGLLLLNITTNEHVLYNHNGYTSGLYRPNRIAFDTRDGRIGAYIRNDDLHVGQNSRLLYIDTGSAFTNPADDTLTWIQTSGQFNATTVSHIEFDQDRDALYVSLYGVGLGMLHDDGTPTNLATNTYSVYIDSDDSYKTETITSIAIDSVSSPPAIFYLNSNPSYRILAAVVFDDESSTSLNDATVYELANRSDLFGQSVANLTFMPGPEFIGNQLFITTDEGAVLYYNTNNSYHDPFDDTVIRMTVAGDLYPARSTKVVVGDYNTVYTTIDRHGFIRVDLDRSFESINTAVGISIPEEQTLYANHIVLDQLSIAARVNAQGQLAPDSEAAVNTYVSIDDGFTWEPISVGQRIALETEDYRVRFRLDLVTNPSTTPIVDAYSLSFASYTQIPDDPELQVTTNVATIPVSDPFSMQITAADDLGFPVLSYGELVTVELYNAITNQLTTGISVDSAQLVNGVIQLTGVSINQLGSFFIRVSDGNLSADSAIITITEQPPAPSDSVPSMTFSASSFTITKGQSTTLSWTSSNLTGISINQGLGAQSLNGSVQVSPNQTTTYTLTGTGPYGGLQSSVTITVNQSSSSDSSSSSDASSESSSSDEEDSDSDLVGSDDAVETDVQTLFLTGLGLDDDVKERLFDSETGEFLFTGGYSLDGTVFIESRTQRKQVVAPRSTVRIAWNVIGNPYKVYVDYLDQEVSSQGSFDFIATEDVEIRVIAFDESGTVLAALTFEVTVDESLAAQRPPLTVLRAGEMIAAAALTNWPLTTVAVTYSFGLLSLAQFLGASLRNNWRRAVTLLLEIPIPHKGQHWGHVFDDTTHAAIALVPLFVRDAAGRVIAQTTTDFKGRYRLPLSISNPKGYSIQVTAQGYEPAHVPLHVGADHVLHQEITIHALGVAKSARTFFWTTVFPKIMSFIHAASALLMLYALYHGITSILAGATIMNVSLFMVHFVFFVFFAKSIVQEILFAVSVKK